MLDPILSIKNLNLSFISTRNKLDSIYLFKDLNLNVPRDTVTALLGGNGVGKTTLFNVISGIQKCNSGSITFNNEQINDLLPYQISNLGIARLFQNTRIFEELSILDNMKIGSSYPKSESPLFNLFCHKRNKKYEMELERKAEEIFFLLFGENNPFYENRYKQGSVLSYGQQRLLALARLLMGDYSLYLLDEPTAGVHESFVPQITNAILNISSQNKSVIIIEHNIAFIRKLANYCYFMADGDVQLNGKIEDVLNNEKVKQIYWGL